ncbi:MAG: site-2 protease family protein [Candidatus Omnitrophica bacterium]|nr:site-2 protease family protein [Candidatus Omnitrophota bacterium]
MFGEAILIILVLFTSVVLHEYAHGWTAYKLGDPTAKLAGRLTLNPIMHVDPVGTIFIPGVLITMRLLGIHTFVFGWAKPVPVNFGRLNNPRRDMVWVGLAGPAVNILLAVIFSQLARLNVPSAVYHFAETVVFINLLLAIFNMIPVPPLDGSRLVMGILPRALAVPYSRLERYGILIVVLLISMGVFENVVLPVLALAGKLLGMEF